MEDTNTDGPRPTIMFTQEKVQRFKRHYSTAVEAKRDCFQFEGHSFLVSYARYLIQYLEERFK